MINKVVAGLFFLIFSIHCFAGKADQLEALSKKYTLTIAQILAAQNSLINNFNKNELDISKLETVYGHLSTTQLEIDSIDNQLFLETLITNNELNDKAKQFIGLQVSGLLKQLRVKISACEKLLTKVSDEKVMELILVSRDLLKESEKELSNP